MPQKYPKPPIVEAILQVRYGSALDDASLSRIPKLLQRSYPKAKPEADFAMEFEIKDGGATASPPKLNTVDKGARLLSEDDQRTVISRTKSIVFAHQAPYPGWDRFLAEARDVIGILREKLGFRQVQSVGLRYANRIDVPVSESQTIIPGDYMVVGPALPDMPISTSVRAYQLVTDLELNAAKLIARIQAATLEPALINHASLLLDIDIVSQHDVPQKMDDFWVLVERMRDAKNDIFESCITDRARQLFGGNP